MPKPVDIANAELRHAEQIAAIYNQALVTRTATFETQPRSTTDIADWLQGNLPIKIAMWDGKVAGFAKVSPYRDRECYAGIKEYSVYVDEAFHRRGVGLQLLTSLTQDCRQAGVWKLLSRIFPENKASIALAKQAGFRVVGTYRKHGQLDGVWKDCVIVEKLLLDIHSQ